MSGFVFFVIGFFVGGLFGLLGISLMTTSKTASLREYIFILKDRMRGLELDLKECQKRNKELEKAVGKEV